MWSVLRWLVSLRWPCDITMTALRSPRTWITDLSFSEAEANV
jgi:hypothetical protein